MRIVAPAAVFCLLLLATGCGGDGGYTGPTGSLSGKVTIDGAVPPDGTVMVLIHKESGAGASAKLQSDGSYKLTNVRVGVYMVGFANTRATQAQEMDADQIMKEQEAGTYKQPPSAFPENLSSPESSGLTVTVPEGSGSFDIQA